MFTRDIIIYSGSIPASGSSEGQRPVSSSTFKQVAKWEIDPDDPSSIQLRVPKEISGTANDRIAFYVSGSGKIGIGTKDPQSAFDVKDIGEDKADASKTDLFKVDKDAEKNLGSLKLKNARTIGGVSFDGTANINLPGVNAAGNQNTTGNADTATKIASITNTNIVQLAGDQTLTGTKTFSETIVGSINGNSATTSETTITGGQASAITANTAKVSLAGGTGTALSFGDMITTPSKIKGQPTTYSIVMTATKGGVSKSVTLTLT